MESTAHDHCESCFRLQCSVSCKMAACDNGCGLQMHFCKMNDHKSICQKARVPCPSVEYGCPAIMLRESVKNHLKSCPASIVFCTMEWNRYPVYSRSRLNWVPFFQPNPVLVKGQLDVELALRDQKVLKEMSRQRLRKGKAKVEKLRLNSAGSHNGQPGERTEISMALALSSLEFKLRSQKMNSKVNGKSPGQIHARNDNFLKLTSDSGGEKQMTEQFKGLPRSDSEREKTTNDGLENETEPLKIELHSLARESKDEEGDFQNNSTVSESSIPLPPIHVPMYLDQPLGLNVMIETLPKFQKQFPMYSIPCNQVFRREEYSDHFRNVHSDIQGGLNGWLEQRCPLAQYGCTFVNHRFLPHGQCGMVLFSQDLGSFGVKPCAAGTGAVARPQNDKECSHQKNANSCSTTCDLLTCLPVEILENIAKKLDGFSLCNFSRTCKHLREVCQNVVERRGMVILDWEKRAYEHGKWAWRVRQKVRI